MVRLSVDVHTDTGIDWRKGRRSGQGRGSSWSLGLIQGRGEAAGNTCVQVVSGSIGAEAMGRGTRAAGQCKRHKAHIACDGPYHPLIFPPAPELSRLRPELSPPSDSTIPLFYQIPSAPPQSGLNNPLSSPPLLMTTTLPACQT